MSLLSVYRTDYTVVGFVADGRESNHPRRRINRVQVHKEGEPATKPIIVEVLDEHGDELILYLWPSAAADVVRGLLANLTPAQVAADPALAAALRAALDFAPPARPPNLMTDTVRGL